MSVTNQDIPTGTVALTRASGTAKAKFTSNDAPSRGAALVEAVGQASDGDTIVLGPGEFELDAVLTWPSGVNLVGAGMTRTRIYGEIANVNLVSLAGCENAELRDVYIDNSLAPDGQAFGGAIGTAGNTTSPPKNVRLINLRTFGRSDGLWIVTSDLASQGSLMCFDCLFEAAYDGFAQWASTSSEEDFGVDTRMFNCTMIGTRNAAGSTIQAGARLDSPNSLVEFYNCRLAAMGSSGSATVDALAINAGSNYHLYGGTLFSSSSAGTVRDMNFGAKFDGTVRIAGTRFDPAKVNTPSRVIQGSPTIARPVDANPADGTAGNRPKALAGEIVRYTNDDTLWYCTSGATPTFEQIAFVS